MHNLTFIEREKITEAVSSVLPSRGWLFSYEIFLADPPMQNIWHHPSKNWKAKARNRPWPQKYYLATNAAQKIQTNTTWGKKKLKGPNFDSAGEENKPETNIFKLQLCGLKSY